MVDLLHAYSKHCDGHPPAELALKAAQSRRPKQAAPRARSARQLRHSEIDELVARYLEVGNVADVARQFGVTRQTVGTHLASRGIETVRRMSEANITVAAALYGRGSPPPQSGAGRDSIRRPCSTGYEAWGLPYGRARGEVKRAATVSWLAAQI